MIFLKGSGLNDDVFKGSQAPIEKFLLESEATAMREHNILEEIYNIVPTSEWAIKFTGLTGKGVFSDVGSL